MRRLFVATLVCAAILLLAVPLVAGAAPSSAISKDGGACGDRAPGAARAA